MLSRPKIAVIGSGFVGSTTAHLLAVRELGDIVLLDIAVDAAKGKALDLFESSPAARFDAHITGTGSYEDVSGADVVVITAGVARKPGMSRDELLSINVGIVKAAAENIKKYAPNAIIIVVTNPLDAMVYAAWKASGFAPNRVMGMAGVLDGSRMRSFIAAELGVSVEDVQALVLGGHGDTMVPVISTATVGGVPLKILLDKEKLQAIVKRTQNGGAEIVELLKTGSAYYAPAASIVVMVESLMKDQKRVLPCAAYLQGEYGVQGVFIGVPAVLGKNGVERILEIPLDADELSAFQRTTAHVQSLVKGL